MSQQKLTKVNENDGMLKEEDFVKF